MKNEQIYKNSFDKSSDAIQILHNGKFVNCNQATLKILLYNTKEDFLKKHPSEISPEKQIDGKSSFKKANDMISIALKTGNHQFEWLHTKSNGEIFPTEVLLTAIANGKNNQIIHAVIRDISNRKKAEEELVKYRDHLEELVGERTSKLEEKNTELERLNKLFINREYRIQELRDELKKYEK